MRQIKMTLRAGLVILLGLLIFGESTESRAQSGQALEPSQQKLRDQMQSVGFITSKPIPSWGTIVGNENAVVNLSKGEVVYIHLQPGKEVKPGDRFTIMHLGQAITHPITKEKIGHLVVSPGKLVILEGKDYIVTAKIHESNRPIFSGDYILAPAPVLPEAVPIRTLKKIEGRVIFSQEGIENITSNEFVFIDRGSQDGVVVGALFKIYQMGHYLEEILKDEKIRFPLNKVGEAVVVSVQKETSTALITLSSQAIYIGDQAVSGPE
jgi:hypothetical protein